MYLKQGKEHSRYKHGQAGTPLYKKWEAMKRRCLNKNDKSYPRYGGRGIKICEEWLDFEGFAKDMASTFKLGLSLERLDNNGNYETWNCIWIPMADQNKNKRNATKYTYKGLSMTLPDWEKELGFKQDTLRARIKRQGMSFEEAIAKDAKE